MGISHSPETPFKVAADVEMPPLEGVASTASVGEPTTDEFEVVYFETEQRSLAGADVQIWRETGVDAGWYLRSPTFNGPHMVCHSLGEASYTVPKPFQSAVQGVARGQTLRGGTPQRIHRVKRELVDSDGDTLAEVYDDKVTAAGSHDDAPDTWRMWRLKPAAADATTITAISEAMVAAGATPFDHVAKPLLEPARLQAKSPASGVLGARLQEQVVKLRLLDPLVRLDIPDTVHKSRVAMRRLRSALATFRPFFDRQVTEPLRDELRWIAGILGEVRDTEVTHLRIVKLLESEQQYHPEIIGKDLLPLIDSTLNDRYRRAHDAALEAMESDRYFALQDRLETLVSDPPWTDLAARLAKDVLPARVARDYKRLRRRIKSASKTDEAHHRAELLHESRKAAKRVRYAAETLAPIYDEARSFVAAIEKVQSRLGTHHDSMVNRQELMTLAEVSTSQGVNALPLGLLYVREETYAVTAEEKFLKAWKKASRPKKRRWLE